MPIRGQRISSRRLEWLAFAGLMLAAAIYHLIYLNHPFQRDPEGCGAFYGLVARNYLLWPWSVSRGVMIESLGVGHGPPWFYPNHPALLPLLISGVFKLFGEGEWQTRLTSVLFTLACATLIYQVIRTRVGFRAAMLASFFFLVSPMTLLFGGQPDVINAQLDFFILLSILAYLRFSDTPNSRSLLWLAAAFTPAAFTDWPAFYLCIVIGVHYICTHRVRQWGWLAAFAAFTVVLFAIPYCQGIAVMHEWNWMARFVARRTISTSADRTGAFTSLGWFQRAIGHHAYNRHNGPILPLMIGWLVLAAVKRKRPEIPLIGLTLAWAALHVLVGRQGVYVHEWWWWPLTPGAAMAAGVMLDWAWGMVERWIADRGLTSTSSAESRNADWKENQSGDSRSAVLQSATRLSSSKSILALLILLPLYLFAQHNVRSVAWEWEHPQQIKPGNSLNYSLAEFGDVIHCACPLNTAVALGENDASLAFWYYADRPLMQNVWDPQGLLDHLAAQQADLPFSDIQQSWTGPVSAYILPRAYAGGKMQTMIDWMNAKYPRTDLPKFLVWDLRRPR